MKMFALPSLLRPAALAVLCVSFSSCGDDPELVRKREEQKAEIRLLDGELKILREKISQIPPDRSTEISKLKKEADLQQVEIAKLEQDIEVLQKQKADVEKEHEAYRRKYVVR